MEHGCCNSYTVSSRSALRHNYLTIKKHIGDNVDIIPVLKDDGYGFGDLDAVRTLMECGAKITAVAQVIEGVRMREGGIKIPILVLGGVPENSLPYAVKYDLQTVVFTEDNARAIDAEAAKQNKTAIVQLKIDTGMHRIGVQPGEPLARFLDMLKTLKHIRVVGTFTHFATADNYDDPFMLLQYSRFKDAVAQIKADGFFELSYIHCRNSCGTAWFRGDDICTHVRPAALILGYGRMADGSSPLPLQESLSMRAFITAVKDVPVGETVGYGRFFRPEKPARVATVSMGYGDGLFRALATTCHGPVLVNDTLCHYVGLCMDQLFIDVTGVPCKVGDEITVYGHSPNGAFLSCYDVAAACGQTIHTFIVTQTRRVAREYTD